VTVPDDQVRDDQVAEDKVAEERAAEGPAADDQAAGDGTAEDRRKPTKSRVLLDVHIPKAWLAGMVTALVFLAVVAAIALSAVYNSDRCGVCHIVKPEVDTYKASAHYAAGVTCQQCHTKPGVFNYFIRNLQGMTNIVLYASGQYHQPITTYVGADNCVQCHPKAEIEKDQVFGNIRVNHTGLREAGYQCLTCHANISHPGTRLEAARVPNDKMAICARCHDGEQLPDDCGTCHVGGAPAEEIDVPIQGHLTGTDCSGCHKGKAICADCHQGLQMPHPRTWERGHGRVVVDRGKSICVSCHLKDDKSFCIDCHGVQMPHPSAWVSQHDNVAARGQQVCVKCHGKNSCIKCHGLQMPHPAGFGQTHPSTYYASPGTCSKCHSSSFCSNCHGVSLPHSGGFIASHWQYSVDYNVKCAKCHGTGAEGGANSCYGGECHSGSPDAGG